MKILLKAVLRRLTPMVLIMLALAGCDSGSTLSSSLGENTAQGCFFGSGKNQVLDIMQDWYLWNDEAEQLNKYRDIELQRFSNADNLLDFLRYRPGEFDRGFSYITTPEEEAAFFGEGEFVGFGVGLMRVDADEIRFSQVFSGSPAEAAGFQRGYRLLTINGRSIAEIEAGEGLAAALGPAEVGFTVIMTVEDVGGVTLPPEILSKEVIRIDPVPLVRVINADTGYILFNTFITSASNELRDAFAFFGDAGVDKVVIDLRYNGGGLVSVSEVLGSLLAGPGYAGDVYIEQIFNSARAAEFNERISFHSEPDALDLDKIVFITSGGSASASELVINGLEPYFQNPGEFALVGSPTYGKPVGQFAFDFCNDSFRLRAVTFKSVNVDGDGEYYNGLPVNCAAEDDLLSPLGDENEASLAVALEYLETGDACPLSFAPGFNISQVRNRMVKSQPVTGPGLAQQFAGAF